MKIAKTGGHGIEDGVGIEARQVGSRLTDLRLELVFVDRLDIGLIDRVVDRNVAPYLVEEGTKLSGTAAAGAGAGAGVAAWMGT